MKHGYVLNAYLQRLTTNNSNIENEVAIYITNALNDKHNRVNNNECRINYTVASSVLVFNFKREYLIVLQNN